MLHLSAISLHEDLRDEVVRSPVAIFLHQLVCLSFLIGVDVKQSDWHPQLLPYLLHRFHRGRNTVRAPVGVDDEDCLELAHAILGPGAGSPILALMLSLHYEESVLGSVPTPTASLSLRNSSSVIH